LGFDGGECGVDVCGEVRFDGEWGCLAPKGVDFICEVLEVLYVASDERYSISALCE